MKHEPVMDGACPLQAAVGEVDGFVCRIDEGPERGKIWSGRVRRRGRMGG